MKVYLVKILESGVYCEHLKAFRKPEDAQAYQAEMDAELYNQHMDEGRLLREALIRQGCSVEDAEGALGKCPYAVEIETLNVY